MLNLNGIVVAVIGIVVLILAQFNIIIPDVAASAISGGIIALIGAIYQVYNYKKVTGTYKAVSFSGLGNAR